MAAQKTTTATEVLEAIFRHKYKAFGMPLAVIAAGLAIALFAPRTYRSEAKLHLQVGRDSVGMDPAAQTGQPTVTIQQLGRDSEITTAMELLTSRGVISKVVDALGPDFVLDGGPAGSGGESSAVADAMTTAYDSTAGAAIKLIKSIDPIGDREEAIIEVEENLGVDAERDSTLIEVTYSTKTPEGARMLLAKLIDVYRDEHLRINRNDDSRVFLEEQEEQFREQLDEAMKQVRFTKDEIGVASIATRREHLEGQLQSITMSTFQAEAERTSAAARVSDLRRQLTGTPERLVASKKSVPNAGADLMREKLYELQVRQADLKARYSDSHPSVIAISRQVEEAENVVDTQQVLREETIDDVNPIHRQLSLDLKQRETELASLDARLGMLSEQETAVRKDLKKLNADALRLALLERDQGILERKYFRYTENREQARIDQELEEENISSIAVAQEPTLAEKPVSPSKLLVGLGSLFLAFAGTAATLIGLEQVNDKLRTEGSIEQATAAPVLASIPESQVHGRVLAP
ncbi:MAG: Wzz/FepE/Etk N-terminal domain-containing protein [Planctomycetota bacterium]